MLKSPKKSHLSCKFVPEFRLDSRGQKRADASNCNLCHLLWQALRRFYEFAKRFCSRIFWLSWLGTKVCFYDMTSSKASNSQVYQSCMSLDLPPTRSLNKSSTMCNVRILLENYANFARVGKLKRFRNVWCVCAHCSKIQFLSINLILRKPYF